MKKLIITLLVGLLVLSLGVTVFADPKVPSANPEPGAREAVILNAGFHCNADGGNGRVWVEAYEAKFEADKALKKSGLGGVLEDLIYLDDNCWLLDSEDYVCPNCGSNVWVSYSNKSGVPDGKNIQLTHGDLSGFDDEDPTCTINIPKYVNGIPFAEWIKGFVAEKAAEIIAGMQFNLYTAAGILVPITAEFGYDGIIVFKDVKPGSYYVREECKGAATEIFNVTEGNFVYGKAFVVGSKDIGGKSLSYISGKDFGTVVKHDGTGVNYVLPDVWDRVLADQDAYKAMKAMGAEWVWNTDDTYIYGVSGSVYEDEFTFTAGEAGSNTLYFAADNAAVIYVNGKLVGYTEVAFNTPGNPPAELLEDFDRDDLTAKAFDGGWATGWNYSYSVDFDYEAGENTITIIAVNSAQTIGTGTDNDGYNELNNPCGLLFGFEIPGVTFDNTTK